MATKNDYDAGGNTPGASTDAENNGAVASTDYSKSIGGYDKSIDMLEEARKQYESANETPEEQAKREKREKSKRIVAAVGDGLRALSNLYFTTKGAPNMYNHQTDSMMAQVDERQEKLKAERDANRDKYLNYSLKIGDLQNDRAKTLREMEAQQEKMKLAREAAAREEEAHGWKRALQPDLQRKATGDANTAESKAIAAQAEADNAAELQKAKLATEKARAEAQKASAAAHGRSNAAEFVAYDESGREHKFKTKAAADAYARQHGTFISEDKVTETTTKEKDPLTGEEKTRTSKQITSGNGYSRKLQTDNTPPSRRVSNSDNTPPSRR